MSKLRNTRKASVFTSKNTKESDFPESGKICFAMVGHGNNVIFKSAQLDTTNITEIIEADKQYGTFTPRNGKYFTFRIMNDDVEITNKQVLKAVQYSFRRIAIRTHLLFKKAKPDEYADFRVEFRTVATDEDNQLTSNTLMYHYYPINSYTNKYRGLCVINAAYFWTSHGNPLPLHEIDPTNYPNPTTNQGGTYDLDQVYTHEVLHGLGLPHSKTAGNIMSPNYGIMSEFLSGEDVARIKAKYGDRGLDETKIKRWLKWLLHASDRD